MKMKLLLSVSCIMVTAMIFSQQNLGVGQENPLAKVHVTNSDTQSGLRVDDQDSDISNFQIDEFGNTIIKSSSQTSSLNLNGKMKVDSIQLLLSNGTDKELVSDANGNASWASRDIAQFVDHKVAEEPGGTNVVGWQIRELNLEVYNRGTNIQFNNGTNEITVQPGTYLIEVSAPAYRVNKHKIRLKNTTTNSIIANGTTELASEPILGFSSSEIEEILTFTTTTSFVIEHYTESVRLNNGLGIQLYFGGAGNFTTITIKKI